jgi:hypothetical protein
VPIVICPCSEALCRASARHLITMDVLDIDTCSHQDVNFLLEQQADRLTAIGL